MMITKAQVELVKSIAIDEESERFGKFRLEALSALIAVGEKLADGTHVLVPAEPTQEDVEKVAKAIALSDGNPDQYWKVYDAAARAAIRAMIAAAK